MPVFSSVIYDEEALKINFGEERDFRGASLTPMTVESTEKQAEKFSVKFRFENRDSFSFWAPLDIRDRMLYPTWRTSFSFETNYVHGIPLMQFLDKAGNNLLTFALSDFMTHIKLRGGIDERSGKIEIEAEFLNDLTPGREEYSTVVYCDTRRIPYYECLYQFDDYRDSLGYVPAKVPEAATRRIFSSWYSFQRNIDEDRLFEQCVLAKEYGMDTVIIDDGWQTPARDQFTPAYLNAGDWETYTPKFKDMGALVEKLHGIGMKVVLWIATPYIGRESRIFREFEGKFLKKDCDDGSVMIPDPRYTSVREFYLDFLTDRMKRWNLDGYKLDFVSCFTPDEKSASACDEMSIKDIGEAVVKLMSDIHSALTAVNPDVLIEYRQGYMGPTMQISGNMMRVGDIAYGAMYNRVNGIDLRLMANKTAINSDMIMWDYDASPEAVADQLTALLFIVPQVSMFFEKLPESHRKVLKFYLDFIDDNRDILQGGKLVPLFPEALYSVVYAEKDSRVIAAIYSAFSFKAPAGTKELTVVNASGTETVYIDLTEADNISGNYRILNCMGETMAEGKISSPVSAYDIPQNGMIIFGENAITKDMAESDRI